MRTLVLVLVSMLGLSCGAPPAGEPALDLDAGRPTCTRTDPRVGWFAELSTKAHGVRGRVTLTDACTLTLSDFTYDGGGLDVRLVLAPAMTGFARGTPVGPQLLRGGGYQNETLLLAIPPGLALSDLERVSVWCVAADADFGSGTFRAP
ncbi:MAG: DM13 domain-containing protein [Archangium sp.]|nr:DM13 domain-containing protein [Archangium sp.]MDP3569235.1 DM13 domain-containing protein [Archangium sp.]